MAVRNPLVAVLATLLRAAIITPLLLVATLVFRLLGLPLEVSLFYGIAALAVAGFMAGRSGAFAFTAFPVGFLGAFVGYATFVAVLAPPLILLYAVIHATIAALAAWAAATGLMARVTPEVQLENEEKRRCRLCGARVGPKATRCWSCRASLNRIT
jgi:ribosomal protein L40E